MALTSKDRAALRAEANRLEATVHVGHQGVTPTLLQSLEDALRTRELVKVHLARALDDPPRDAARALAAGTGAEVVQVIGRTATLYRHNPELPRRAGDPPAWRR